MKKQLLLPLAIAALLASCSQSEVEMPEVPEVSEQPVPITLSADISASAAPQSRAAVEGTAFPASTTNVFSVVAYAGTAAPSTWASPYFAATTVNSDASSKLALTTARYYPADGTQKLYFYAYAPTTLTLAAEKATCTITGQEDIMAAQEATGISKGTSQATQTQPNFAFSHKLMKLQFKLVKDATFQGNAAVTNITVKEIKTSAQLLINTGVLSFTDATADKTVKLDLTTNNAIDGRTLAEVLMIEPKPTVKLSITAGGVVYPDLTVTLSGANAGTAGMNHLITLTFKQNSIVPTASIAAWGTTGSGAGDMI